MSFIYVGQPYTATKENGTLDYEVMEMRYQEALWRVARLLNKGIHVYSPIVHCHALAKAYDLPREFDFWEEYNKTFLAQSTHLAIIHLPGWEDSKGLQGEINFANECNIPILDVTELLNG